MKRKTKKKLLKLLKIVIVTQTLAVTAKTIIEVIKLLGG